MATTYSHVLWCTGLHWEDSRVCYVARHITSSLYCTLSVTQCLSVYRNSAWTYSHTKEFSYNSLGCHPVCCWLVSRCLVLCCPTKKRIVATLFCDTIWWGLVFPLQKAFTHHACRPAPVMCIPRLVQRVPPLPPLGQVMCEVSEWYRASLAQVSGQIKLCSQKPEFPRTSDVYTYLSWHHPWL